MNPVDLLVGLPGEAIMREGLADYQSGRPSIAACLVEIAGPRLRHTGLVPPAPPSEARRERERVVHGLRAQTASGDSLPDPELRLYRLLRQQGGDAYSRYGALLRELVSFEHALDRRFRAASWR